MAPTACSWSTGDSMILIKIWFWGSSCTSTMKRKWILRFQSGEKKRRPFRTCSTWSNPTPTLETSTAPTSTSLLSTPPLLVIPSLGALTTVLRWPLHGSLQVRSLKFTAFVSSMTTPSLTVKTRDSILICGSFSAGNRTSLLSSKSNSLISLSLLRIDQV